MTLKSKGVYELELNREYATNIESGMIATEHCWAGKDKSPIDKKCAKAYAIRGHVGTVLRKFDPIGFMVGYNEWRR